MSSSRDAVAWGGNLVMAFVLGVGIGTVGSFLQAVRIGPVPVGVILALAVSALAVAVAAGLGTARLLPVAATAGWLLAVVPLAGRRPEGDLVVAGDAVGYVWAYGGMATVTCVCLSVIALRAARPAPRGGRS